jgi:hypothetical protein
MLRSAQGGPYCCRGWGVIAASRQRCHRHTVRRLTLTLAAASEIVAPANKCSSAENLFRVEPATFIVRDRMRHIVIPLEA